MSARYRRLVMVKLGGSLVTDKQRDAHARYGVIERLAHEIATAAPTMDQALLLGHGSGSFGHVAATRYGLADGLGDGAAIGAAATQSAAQTLHRLVVEKLLAANVPAWSWAPSSALVARDGRLSHGSARPLATALDAGLVPVVYGDVVADVTRRASIASTEAVVKFIMPRLARLGHGTARLLWLGETDGIYDADGERMPRIDPSTIAAARAAVGGSSGVDVTGGMALRLETAWHLATRGVDSWILDGTRPGLLKQALVGEFSDLQGTLITADGALA